MRLPDHFLSPRRSRQRRSSMAVWGRSSAAVLALLALVLTAGGSFAQQAPVSGQMSSSIVGSVVDGETLAPLSSVLVSIHPANDSTVLSTRLTDQNGRFIVPALDAGRYTVTFKVIGYAPLTQDVLVDATSPGAADLGSVLLRTSAVALEAVEAVAERPAVIIAADRDIYSVDAMPVAGGTATDVLTNVADVQLDVDGNVTLRGERPTIYINGRPAPMRGEALAVFLQGFPAENIENVEVMTNPSARFEAEGTGGIINIVLRRGANLGLTGNASVNGGSRGDLGSTVRTTYMAGDLTLIGGTSLRLTQAQTRTSDLRENRRTDPVTFLGQEATSDRSTWSGNLDLSAEYAISEATDIDAEVSVSRNSANADRLTAYTEMDAAQLITDEYDRLIADDAAGLNGDFALQLSHEFERRSHELSFEIQYQRGRDAEESFIRQRALQDIGVLDPATELTLEDDNETESELSLRGDYVRPWGGRGQVEVGLATEFGTTDERRVQQVGLEGSAENPTTTLDRGFLHEQTISALYLTAMQRLGDFNVQLGIRGEHAARTLILPGEDGFENTDLSVFPNANLTYNIGGGKRLRLAYSMRVQRPSSSVLNPTNTSDDPFNIRVGNPAVESQQTHSISVDGSWSGQLGTVRVSPFYRRSLNEWERFKTVDAAGISTTTYENLGETTTYGGSLNLSVRQFKGMGGSINLNAQHQVNDWGALLSRAPESMTWWTLQSNLNGRISADLNLQGSVTYNPARDLPQGRSSSTVMTRIGLRQRLLNGRASLNLNVTDPFQLYQPFTRTADQTFVETGRERRSARTGTLSFSYTFGGRGRGGGGGGGGGGRPAAVNPGGALPGGGGDFDAAPTGGVDGQ